MIVGITGHRPQFTPAGYERNHPWKIERIAKIKQWLLSNKNEIDFLITGMALGWDQWVAYTCLKINLPIVCYIPFEGQESSWSNEHQKQYHDILKRAKSVKYICGPGYSAWKMHMRDRAIVNDSNVILALWNPEKQDGGTYKTLQYAKSKNREVVNCWEGVNSD